MVLVVLALLVQLAGFILVDFVGVIDPIQDKQPSPTSRAAMEAAAEKSVERSEAAGRASYWDTFFEWTLPAMKFVAMASGLLAIVTLTFAVMLSVVGRLGGIAAFMSAFFWSLILVAMITPWQQLLHGSFASGALYNLGYLKEQASLVKGSWGAKEVELLDWIFYYARFIAYPVIALLIWLAVMLKFASGHKASSMAPAGLIPTQRPAEL